MNAIFEIKKLLKEIAFQSDGMSEPVNALDHGEVLGFIRGVSLHPDFNFDDLEELHKLRSDFFKHRNQKSSENE
jgi:gamma-glutamyl-gamma-aminobutyrate hydrolase PuuD